MEPGMASSPTEAPLAHGAAARPLFSNSDVYITHAHTHGQHTSILAV
jgi:hypothetical protein